MALAKPSPDFANQALAIEHVEPTTLVRVTRYPDTEPYFGKTGGNRFDDSLRGFGVCYAGQELLVAFAETILHDALPFGGEYRVAEEKLADRHVVSFYGEPLDLANLTGPALKRLGGTNEISAEVPYNTPQLWSRAVYEHPSNADGLIYVSRHINTRVAFALFERSRSKLRRAMKTPLLSHPELADVLDTLGVAVF